jgi:hypothetical protein
MTHPCANPNTIITDIDDGATITMRIINVYHQRSKRHGHTLNNLLSHELDDQIPTLLIGDFNTHSPLWSTPDRTPDSWASTFTDWLKTNGLHCLNPRHITTWMPPNNTQQASVLDLVFANDAAYLSAQLGEVDISFDHSLGSDHAAVTIHIYPLDSPTLIPPPAPTGYRAKDEHKDAWMKEFVMLLPPCLPYAPEHSTPPPVPAWDHEDRGDMVHASLKPFDDAIKEASRRTLPPKWIPDPKGARWWNDACSVAHTLARTATGNTARKAASLNLKRMVVQAKREWAHNYLHHATEASDIWRMAATRKGRPTRLFPPLRREDGT